MNPNGFHADFPWPDAGPRRGLRSRKLLQQLIGDEGASWPTAGSCAAHARICMVSTRMLC